jgi:peptidoglycan-N-acetylglucosamine deacetylase
MSGVAKLARVKQQNRTKRLLPGKALWLAIVAALSLAAIFLLHSIFGGIPADALIAKTGVAQTVDAARDIATKIPMNFDVPNAFQSKTIKDAPIATGDKVIALTFDDGPWPETTDSILATLKQEKIKATFFMIGQPLKEFPAIGKRVLADGHAIANHTWHHWYKKMTPAVAQKEIEDTAKIIKEVLNIETAYFRPPGGVLTNGLVSYAHSKKQSVLMWSVDSNDSHPRRPSAAAMIKTVLAQATPGGIVLMHDGGGNHGNTAKALPEMITKLRAQGYKFVTIPELLELASIPPAAAASVKVPPVPVVPPTTPTLPDAPVAAPGTGKV